MKKSRRNLQVFPVFSFIASFSDVYHDRSIEKQRQRKFIKLNKKKISLRAREPLEYFIMNLKLTQMLFAKCAFSNNFQDQPFPLQCRLLSCPFRLNCCVAFPIRYRSLISMLQPDGFNLKFLSYEFFSSF